MTASARRLIVNADDFGHSPEVNAGIVEAHERGIVTSASLMVRRPAAVQAARYRGPLAVGLHVELGEWTYRGRRWVSAGEVAPARVADEIHAQVERFRELAGREPTHLDSHQHVHREEPARSALAELAVQLGLPLRESDPRIRYLGGFYGQTDTGERWPEGVTTGHLVSLLRSLEPGLTELGCHPAKGTPAGTTYAEERTLELSALCSPRVREVIEEERIELLSFAGLTLASRG
jgi:chitin disaccharide deacetylase